MQMEPISKITNEKKDKALVWMRNLKYKSEMDSITCTISYLRVSFGFFFVSFGQLFPTTLGLRI